VFREHLRALLDDKTIRDTLVLFTIDSDDCVVHAEHRADVMAVLIP
jgi:hypothetical protein